MAGYQIKVTPEQLEQLAARADQSASEVEAQVGKAKAEFAHLASIWQGDAASGFLQGGEAFQADSAKMAVILREFGQNLRKTAVSMRQADQDVLGKVGSMP